MGTITFSMKTDLTLSDDLRHLLRDFPGAFLSTKCTNPDLANEDIFVIRVRWGTKGKLLKTLRTRFPNAIFL